MMVILKGEKKKKRREMMMIEHQPLQPKEVRYLQSKAASLWIGKVKRWKNGRLTDYDYII